MHWRSRSRPRSLLGAPAPCVPKFFLSSEPGRHQITHEPVERSDPTQLVRTARVCDGNESVQALSSDRGSEPPAHVFVRGTKTTPGRLWSCGPPASHARLTDQHPDAVDRPQRERSDSCGDQVASWSQHPATRRPRLARIGLSVTDAATPRYSPRLATYEEERVGDVPGFSPTVNGLRFHRQLAIRARLRD